MIPRPFYPDDFEIAWQAFKSPRNSSKSDAYKAWKQTVVAREAFGCTQSLLLHCIDLWQKDLDNENIERAKRRESFHPKCHMATWLRGRRWENYLDDARAIEERQAEQPKQDRSSWNGKRSKLVEVLGEPVVAAWFDQAILEGQTVALPTKFKARWFQDHYAEKLARMFPASFPDGVKVEVRPG